MSESEQAETVGETSTEKNPIASQENPAISADILSALQNQMQAQSIENSMAKQDQLIQPSTPEELVEPKQPQVNQELVAELIKNGLTEEQAIRVSEYLNQGGSPEAVDEVIRSMSCTHTQTTPEQVRY